MDFNIAPEPAPVRSDYENGIQEIRSGFEIPSARAFNKDVFSRAGNKFLRPENAVEPGALEVPLGIGEDKGDIAGFAYYRALSADQVRIQTGSRKEG